MSFNKFDQYDWNLDQLRALDAVDRCGSFAQAGKELGRATSAISYAINQLETAIDLTVFDRSGHRAELTEDGQAVLAQGRAVLDRARELNRSVHKLREGWESEIQVVVDGIFPMTPVLDAMRKFGQERTPTRLRLMTEYLTGVAERFERDQAVLMLTLHYQDELRFVATPLPRLELLLVAHADHPVHRIPTPVPRHKLRDFVEILVDDSARKPRQRSSGLLFGAEQTLSLSDFQSKREAIRSGLGFGWLPHHLIDELVAKKELRVIELEEGGVHTFNPYIVHRREELAGRGTRLFRRLLLEGFKDYK